MSTLKTLRQIAICLWFREHNGPDNLWADYSSFNSLPEWVKDIYYEEAVKVRNEPSWLIFLDVYEYL